MSDERLRELAESGPRNALSILAALNSRGATGVLRFEPAADAEYVIELLFRNGKLLFATTNRPGARTGEFLVRRKVLTEEEATSALLEARRFGKLFHGYLVEQGIVQRRVLQDLLYERTEELLHAVLHAKEGRFVFEHSPLRQFDRQVPTVDEELFGHLLTYRNLWAHAYAKLWPGHPILRHVPGIEGAERFQSLSDVERKTFELVDGKQPVHRLLEGRRDRVEQTLRLAQLLEGGLLEVVPADPKPGAPARPVKSADSADPQRFAGPVFKTEAAPKQPETSVAPIDLEMLPALTAGTDLNKITATGLTMEDLFVVSQIDGKTSLHQLISITQMGEKPLFRLMHHMVRMGYAELRPRPVPGPPVRSIRPPSRVTAAPRSSRPETAIRRGIPDERPEPPKPAVYEAPPVPKVKPVVPEPPPAPRVKPVVPEPPPAPKAAPAPSAPADPREEAHSLHVRAVAAYNAQNYAAAESLLRRALTLDTQSPAMRAHLSLAIAELPYQMDKAEAMAMEAFEEDPLESQCLEVIGLLKVKLGDYDKAKGLLERAVLLDRRKVPSSAWVLEELKGFQPRRGQKPEELWSKLRKNLRLTS